MSRGAGSRPPRCVLRREDFPAAPAETVEGFLRAAARRPDAATRSAAGFAAVRFEEPSVRERPELTRRLPDGPLRILDVGCGAGGGIALALARDIRAGR